MQPKIGTRKMKLGWVILTSPPSQCQLVYIKYGCQTCMPKALKLWKVSFTCKLSQKCAQCLFVGRVCLWAQCLFLGPMFVCGPNVCMWAQCLFVGTVFVCPFHADMFCTLKFFQNKYLRQRISHAVARTLGCCQCDQCVNHLPGNDLK